MEERPITLGIKDWPGGTKPPAGGGHHVERAAERTEAGGKLSPAKETPVEPGKRDLELENRAKHNVDLKLKLPKDKAKLLKLQEDELAPSNAEIDRLVGFEYDRLVKERATKAAPPSEKSPQRQGPETGKPIGGPRTPEQEAANAADLGLTPEQYGQWKEGKGTDFPMDADSIAARQKALGAEEVPAKPKSFKVRSSIDQYAFSPETPVASFVHDHGLLSKSQAQKAGKYEGNEALWDDTAKLSHPTHNKIYRSTGEMPDVMAQNLYDAGLIKEASVREMNRALEKESAAINKARQATRKVEKETGGTVKQAENFGKGQREEIESGTKPIAPEGLKVGDSVDVDGTKLKVTEIDPEGNVTLEDGRRYGVQEVANEDVIYGELKEAPVAAKAPAPVEGEKFSTKKNFKKVAEGRYEHKDTKLIISKGKESGWDIRDGRTGETIDNLPTRRKAMEAYADGRPPSITAEGKKLKLKADRTKGGFINPEIFKEAAEFGKRLYHRGMDYAVWAKDMVKHLGAKIKNRLKEIWENLTGGKMRPGFGESGEIGRTGKIGYGKYAKAKAAEVVPMSQTMREANARLAKNPQRADELVTALLKNKVAKLDPVDETILAQHQAMLTGMREEAGRRVLNEKLSEGERAEAATKFENIENQLRSLGLATAEGTALKHKGSRQMWHTFRQRDYTADAVKQKVYVAKGGEKATAEQDAFIDKQTRILAHMQAQIEGLRRTSGWRPGYTKPPPGMRDMQYAAFRAKQKLDNLVFRETMKHAPMPMRIWRNVSNVLSVPRAVMASIDLSALRRQGGLLFMSHPIRSLRAMPDMLRAMKSERAFFELMQDIRERPNADLYVQSKLSLTDVESPKITQLEEQYMSQWANWIPAVSHSQRAYVYFLNRLRADTFDAMAATLSSKGVVSLSQAKVISNFINVFTGRGRVPGDYANAMRAANDVFFAPRYVVSRFQALLLQPLAHAGFKGEGAVAKMIAQEYARTLIGYGIVYGIASTALKEFVDVEFDPRSTDFGKIKIGDTRIDIMSGISQPTVFLARELPPIFGLGKVKTGTGKVYSVGGGVHKNITEKTWGGILLDFGRSKLAPVPAAYWNAMEGKKVTGEPTSILPTTERGKFEQGEALSLITPMIVQDVIDSLVVNGVPKTAALSLVAMFGDSVQTYSQKSSMPTRTRRRSRSRSH